MEESVSDRAPRVLASEQESSEDSVHHHAPRMALSARRRWRVSVVQRSAHAEGKSRTCLRTVATVSREISPFADERDSERGVSLTLTDGTDSHGEPGDESDTPSDSGG